MRQHRTTGAFAPQELRGIAGFPPTADHAHRRRGELPYSMRFAKRENRALVPRVSGKRSHIVTLLYSVFPQKSRGFPIFSVRAWESEQKVYRHADRNPDQKGEQDPQGFPSPPRGAPPVSASAFVQNPVRFRQNVRSFLLFRTNVPAQDEICFVKIGAVSGPDHDHLLLCAFYHAVSLSFGAVFAGTEAVQTAQLFFMCEQKT